nr:outer membrane beta-barrel protein [Mesorhizobium sp.]
MGSLSRQPEPAGLLAGAEYAFTDNWTIKGEYLYTDLGDEEFLKIDEFAVVSATLSSEVKFHTVRFGVNYKF